MENFSSTDFNQEGLKLGCNISKLHRLNRNWFYVPGVIVFFTLIYFIFLQAPRDFPVGGILNIEEGKGLHSVSLQLKNAHIIKSRVAFEAFVVLYGGEKHIISADYFFENNLTKKQVCGRKYPA